jgi:hypothetical protein
MFEVNVSAGGLPEVVECSRWTCLPEVCRKCTKFESARSAGGRKCTKFESARSAGSLPEVYQVREREVCRRSEVYQVREREVSRRSAGCVPSSRANDYYQREKRSINHTLWAKSAQPLFSVKFISCTRPLINWRGCGQTGTLCHPMYILCNTNLVVW